MAFYISPPGGNISLQKLTHYAVTRFNFLCQVFDTGGDRLQIFDILNDAETVKDAECLIEGTIKDRLSHFILRLACCCDREMAAFLVKAETLLFDFRFTCMTEEELCRLFKSVDKFRKSDHTRNSYSSEMPSYVKHFLKVMSQITGDNSKWRIVVRRYLNGEDWCFTVPFWTVLHLVATRQVSLRKGIAVVPVCKLRETVTSLFEELLYEGIKMASESFHTDDRRIMNLFKTLKVMFRDRYRSQNLGHDFHYDLCHSEVDDVAPMFPPCMSHLHRTLRLNHRLKHHSRIQYSLFLKEAGMSVHEALMFWRKEYSRVPSNSAGCTHLWCKDEGRYTYNIRHLYGLEGGRINYRGHSCQVLQESNHGYNDSGGCPFSHFDSKHLLHLLHTEGITCASTTKEILQLAVDKQYSQACLLYFHTRMKLIENLKGSSQCFQLKPGFDNDRMETDIKHGFDNDRMETDTKHGFNNERMEKETKHGFDNDRVETDIKHGLNNDRMNRFSNDKMEIETKHGFNNDRIETEMHPIQCIYSTSTIQVNECTKPDESGKCSCCSCRPKVLSDLTNHCGYSKGHCHGNINYHGKHLLKSENVFSPEMLRTKCAQLDSVKGNHLNTVESENLALANGASRSSQVDECTGNISLDIGTKSVSEMICHDHCTVKNERKTDETFHNCAQIWNAHLRHLNSSAPCNIHPADLENNMIFDKPIQYFERSRLNFIEHSN